MDAAPRPKHVVVLNQAEIQTDSARMMILVFAQPVPISSSAIATPDHCWTSILRKWNPGDPLRCRLCPNGTCIADGETCHMVVEGVVEPGADAFFSSLGLPRQVGRPRGPA